MELTQLRYFQVAAEECNFTRAAKRLNISQPALSKAIANLESEIDVRLFIRDGNHLSLSEFGSILLKEVNVSFFHIETGIRNARTRAGLDTGNVFIALSAAVTLTQPIEYFLLDYPDVCFKELPATAQEMEDYLLNGEIDFGITYDVIQHPRIQRQAIYQDRLSVLLCRTHPLAGRSTLRLEDLEGERFLQGDNFGRPISFLQSVNDTEFIPNVVYEGTNKSMVGRLVSKGVGIALAPLSVSLGRRLDTTTDRMEGEHPDIACIPLEDTFWHKSVGIVSLRDHHYSKAAEELMERIIAYYATLPSAY